MDTGAQVPGGRSLAMLLDADTYMGTTEVVLDLTLWKPDGRRIGTYEGHAAKSDEFVPDEQNRPGVVSMGRSPRPSMKFAKRSSMMPMP
jgi:hypothetical protein